MFNRKTKEIARLTKELEEANRLLNALPNVAEIIGDPKNVTQVVDGRNKNTTLYCIDCCTSFNLRKNGEWTTTDADKTANVVADRFIICSCGTALGVIIGKEIPLPGEVVPVR